MKKLEINFEVNLNIMSNIPEHHQRGTETINIWRLCIICQSDARSVGEIVKHPKLNSYQKILDTVKERAELNDDKYVIIHRTLKDVKK